MVADIHYRWDFIGLSTDTKPTPSTSEKVVDGSTYYTSDDSKLYVWYKDQWYEKTVSGGGGGGGEGVKVLTADDYNYIVGGGEENNCVNLSLLEPGFYRVTDDDVYVYTRGWKYNYLNHYLFYVSGVNYGGYVFVYVFNPQGDPTSGMWSLVYEMYSGDNGYYFSSPQVRVLSSNYIADDLTTYNSDMVLSATQGKVLKDLVDSLAVRGAGSPTTATVGSVGTLYEDTTNGKLYICTAVTLGTDPDPDTYTWIEVGAGGGGKLTLSSSDADYPENNPIYINLDKLDGGIYTATEIIGVYIGGYNYTVQKGDSIMIVKANEGKQTLWLTYNSFGAKITISSNGNRVFDSNVVCEYNLRSNWLDTNTYAPTVTTYGYAGKIITSVDTNKVPHLFVCGGPDPNNAGQYMWYEATMTQI